MSRPVATVLTLLVAVPAAASNLFVSTTGSGTACTQASPCTLATAVGQMAGGDTVYVAAGTYTGTGEQVVLLNRELTNTLQGGWDGASGGPLVVDPSAHKTILDGQNARRVITLITGYPTIRGFTIRRGNATGLTAGCQTISRDESGCGGGIFAINAVPTIEGNVIEDNVASAVTPSGKAGYGGGIMIDYNWPRITNNVVRNNVASADGEGWGGGVALHICTAGTTVQANEVTGNVASATSSGGGGGIYTAYGAVAVADNLLEANLASTAAGEGVGAGLYTMHTAPAIDHNVFVGNRGGNVVSIGATVGTGRFAANRVVNNQAAVGIYIGAPSANSSFTAVNNFISDGQSANIVLSGSQSNPLTAELLHNTIVGNGSTIGIRLYDHTDVTLLNNIFAHHSLAIYDTGADQLTVDGTLFWKNNDDGVRGVNAIDGNPNFVNLLLRDYHIGVGSSAVDGAVATAIVTAADIDGQDRPGDPTLRDIGADELPPTRFDFGTATSPVETGYTRVTEADRLEWYTGWGWNAGAVASRERGAGSALNRDFNLTRAATFGVDLPSGTYDVTMTLGDASFAHDQMQVKLEGAVVDTISTAKGQFVTRTWRTTVGNDRLDLVVQDLGGSDANAVVNALVVKDPTVVKVDFGTASSPVAPAFARATQATGYSDMLRFGWTAGLVGCRDRGTDDPLRRDLCFSPEATFRLGLLPTGAYEVLVTIGDASFAHDQMRVRVGGSEYDYSTNAGQFIDSRHLIGGGGASGFNLDITLTDAGGSDANAVVDAVQTELRPAVRLDFGTATSPVDLGWLRVTADSAYRPSIGYGWLSGVVGERDRGKGTLVTRDLNFTQHATFAVDVPPGRYWVDVAVGDTRYAHDQMKATINGGEVGPTDTAAGDYVVLQAGPVNVTDGRLTIELEDVGGSDPYLSVLYIEVQ